MMRLVVVVAFVSVLLHGSIGFRLKRQPVVRPGMKLHVWQEPPKAISSQELEEAKRQAMAERAAALEWKNKWNFQNFKLNLAVDMLVMRVFEQGLVKA